MWNSCLKKKLRQRGIDPNTHKRLSEVEIDKDKSNEKTSNEVNLIEASNSKPPPMAATMDRYPVDVSSTSKINNSIGSNNSLKPTQEFFLDRFGPGATSHESSSTSCRPSDLVGYFSFQHLNYGPDIGLSVNTSLCFNQNSRCSEMIPDYNSSTMTSTMLHSVSSSSSIFPRATRVKPSVSLPSNNRSLGSSDVNGVQNWETSTFSNNGSNSNNGSSSSTIELQGNSNFFENHAFAWGVADHVKSDKQADAEDIKWSEYLHTPFLLGSTLHNQTSHQPICSDIKPETGFTLTDGSSTTWHQQPLQASDIYNKDLQQLAVTFGQTL